MEDIYKKNEGGVIPPPPPPKGQIGLTVVMNLKKLNIKHFCILSLTVSLLDLYSQSVLQ